MATQVIRRALLPNGICVALRAPPSKKSGMMRQLKIHTIPRSPGPIRTSIKRSTTVPRDGSQLTALRGAGFRKMGDVPHISQVRAPLTFSYVHAAQDQSIEHGRGEDRSRATSVTRYIHAFVPCERTIGRASGNCIRMYAGPVSWVSSYHLL